MAEVTRLLCRRKQLPSSCLTSPQFTHLSVKANNTHILFMSHKFSWLKKANMVFKESLLNR